MSQPVAIVIGGINGAGKTTAAKGVLTNELLELPFVNADAIATGLNAFSPESVAFEAGRIMVEHLDKLASASKSFAFESTLSGKTYHAFLKRLSSLNYNLQLYYFWLQSADLAVARVKQRVIRGGHSIPEPTIRSRYARSLRNFWTLYRPIVNRWVIYDNSTKRADLIAEGAAEVASRVFDPVKWQLFQEVAGYGP